MIQRKKPVTDKQTAIEAAVRSLACRALSEQEIETKLRRQDFPSEIICEVISYLKERKYLNDTALANLISQKMIQDGKYGENKIVFKMRQRGIPEPIIQKTMQNFDRATELYSAIAITRKKFSVFNGSDKPRIYRFLANKGFSGTLISQVLNSLKNDRENG
ncbi:MAG: Regulatory protein recX [Firmicutes bacterium]|nr:Regulatory protein recX [Bacillota bacterium]